MCFPCGSKPRPHIGHIHKVMAVLFSRCILIWASSCFKTATGWTRSPTTRTWTLSRLRSSARLCAAATAPPAASSDLLKGSAESELNLLLAAWGLRLCCRTKTRRSWRGSLIHCDYNNPPTWSMSWSGLTGSSKSTENKTAWVESKDGSDSGHHSFMLLLFCVSELIHYLPVIVKRARRFALADRCFEMMSSV